MTESRKNSASTHNTISSASTNATVIDRILGTNPDGSYHVKWQGNGYEYRITGLSVVISNAPFAPGSAGKQRQHQCHRKRIGHTFLISDCSFPFFHACILTYNKLRSCRLPLLSVLWEKSQTQRNQYQPAESVSPVYLRLTAPCFRCNNRSPTVSESFSGFPSLLTG